MTLTTNTSNVVDTGILTLNVVDTSNGHKPTNSILTLNEEDSFYQERDTGIQAM